MGYKLEWETNKDYLFALPGIGMWITCGSMFISGLLGLGCDAKLVFDCFTKRLAE